MIPVVFIHEGNQDYLHVAIEQAQRRNPVLLMGDDTGLPTWASWKCHKSPRFDQVYQHMSTNHEEFERRCFQRWFALRAKMEDACLDRVFYCDSDVMLYCNVTKWAQSVGNPDVSYQVPEYQPEFRWSASAHVSLWSRDALHEFCTFIQAMYSQASARSVLQYKWEWHKETNTPGGVCDMTLLYLWRQLHPAWERHVNNAKVIDGATFDHNINVAENYEPTEYQMKNGVKRAERRPGQLWGYRTYKQDWIRFNALHFQGGAKEMMKEYGG